MAYNTHSNFVYYYMDNGIVEYDMAHDNMIYYYMVYDNIGDCCEFSNASICYRK